MRILDRVRQVAFTKDVEQLKYVHVLDLQKDGYIKPHIDAVRVCAAKKYVSFHIEQVVFSFVGIL